MSNNTIEEHGLNDILNILDCAFKRLTTPSILFISAFIIFKTGKNQEGLNFFLSVGLQSLLITIIGIFIVFASAITALKDIISLNIPPIVKAIPVTIFATTYFIIAVVISTQGIARIATI